MTAEQYIANKCPINQFNAIKQLYLDIFRQQQIQSKTYLIVLHEQLIDIYNHTIST